MHIQQFKTTKHPTSQTLKPSTKNQILTLNSPSITLPINKTFTGITSQ